MLCCGPMDRKKEKAEVRRLRRAAILFWHDHDRNYT